MSNEPVTFTFAIVMSLLFFVGCGGAPQSPPMPQQVKIKVAKNESAQAAIARVAQTLPAEEAAEFSAAAEVLAIHYALRNPAGVALRGPVKAIEGKTPSQVIAEYQQLEPELQKELGDAIQSMKTNPAKIINAPVP
jgi:hypothetical protein